MSKVLDTERRFAGSLTPTANASGTITFNGTGQQVVLPVNTAWIVNFFQAHSHTAGTGAAAAVLTNLSTSDIFARIELTGQGSFAVDNNTREISPVIRSTNGAITLTCVVTHGGASGDLYSCGANFVQVYGDPAL